MNNLKLLFTTMLVIGYIGHSGIYFYQGMEKLSTAMIMFALAMILLF